MSNTFIFQTLKKMIIKNKIENRQIRNDKKKMGGILPLWGAKVKMIYETKRNYILYVM